MKNWPKLQPYQEELLKGLRKGALTHIHMSRQTGKSMMTMYHNMSGQGFARPIDPDWDPWHRVTSLIPRKSISGRWIIGRIQKRGKTIRRLTPTKGGSAMLRSRIHEFATDKELFEWKLKNGRE